MKGLGGSCARRWRAVREATVVLVALTALALPWLAPAPPAAAQSPAGSASSPFVLAPGAGLYDQFGYAPAYTRNVPAFDADGRAYLRSRTSSAAQTSYVHTLEGGRWVRLDFLAALRAAYPTFVQTVGAGGLRNDGIVFDRQDRAYNPVTVELRDGSTRNCLLVSWDHCRTWRAFKLPNGTFTTEHWVGHNELDGPPFLALWRESAPPDLPGSQTNALFVTQPRLEGTELVLPPLVKVTDRCLGLSRDSGGASFAVTRGKTTWFVWSEVAPKGRGGTPHYVSTYDHATNAVGGRRQLATSPTRSDPHNKPGICLDSAGVLHVIAGGHGSPALYTKSLAPLTADAGWTPPVPVLHSGWASVTDPSVQDGRQTYTAFVCDSRDTLHLITRQWRRGVDPYHEGKGYGALVHQSCPAGGTWSEPAVIVAGAYSGYSVFFHKVALDARDRLFLSCSYQGGPELKEERAVGAALDVLGRTQLRPGKYRGRMLLVSDDGGATWRFAADADLAAPGDVTPPQRTEAAARAAASAAAARAASAPRLPALSWRWLNPLPQGNQFTSLAFSGRRAGWAVGTHGTIARTVSGGTAWKPQRSPTTADLFAVAAATGDRAWAVGADGTIVRTADGGATWSLVPSVTTRDLFGTCAVSRREGWAVGDRGTVLHTTNGGLTWSVARSPTSETLFSVAFSDRLHGIAGGNRGLLLRTRDAGRAWKRRKTLTGGPLFSVAVLRDGTAAAAGAQGVVLSSADGGWTWRRLRTRTKESLRAVRLLPRGRMWATGTDVVLRSSDGGRRWRTARLPVPGPCGALAAPGGARVLAGGAGGALCRSSDGGATWRAFGSGRRTDLRAMAGDGTRVVLAGARGLVLTADARGSWSSTVAADDETLEGVAVRGATRWAVGSRGTIVRGDGGGSWTVLPAATGADLHAVAAPAGGAVVVAGDAGTLLTSLDDGRSWVARAPTPDDLLCLEFSGARDGWAGGGAGFGETRAEVARTTDGGVTWTSADLPVWGRVRGLSFADARTGWAAVEDWGIDGDRPQGSVLMTADGGVTWVLQTAVPDALLGVHVAADGSGWAWGERGTALRTADGGATWERVEAGTDADLRAGLVLPSGEVWLAGAGGAVLAGAPPAGAAVPAP